MRISIVTTAEIPKLHQALVTLSQDLGDTHLASLESLTEAVDTWRAVLAMEGETPLGALFAAPLFSTTRGGLGLYVSDLWVAKDARGQGLGVRLLRHAVQQWNPVFVKLSVYPDNTRGQAFYTQSGFAPQDERNMILHGTALDRLKGKP